MAAATLVPTTVAVRRGRLFYKTRSPPTTSHAPPTTPAYLPPPHLPYCAAHHPPPRATPPHTWDPPPVSLTSHTHTLHTRTIVQNHTYLWRRGGGREEHMFLSEDRGLHYHGCRFDCRFAGPNISFTLYAPPTAPTCPTLARGNVWWLNTVTWIQTNEQALTTRLWLLWRAVVDVPLFW